MNDRDALHADALGTLLAAARPMILDKFAADSCIASTRITVDLCLAVGIPAPPIITKTHAKNYAFW
jgi:hypothetical protein